MIKKELYNGIVAICMCIFLFSGCVSTPEEPEPTEAPTDVPVEEKATPEPTEKPTEEPTPQPTEEPTAEPTQTPEPTKPPKPTEKPGPQVGEFWMEVPKKPVTQGSAFVTRIRINTGTQKIAAYGINVTYDSSVIDVDTGKGNNGVDPGDDGFLAAANPIQPGTLFAAGFDVYGKGPGDNLHILTIHWKATGKGTSVINIIVKNLVDEKVAVIGVKKGLSAEVKVE